MNLFNDWKFWTILYLVCSITFAQEFKKANRNAKDLGGLTILLEVFTALFAIIFIPFFSITFPTNIETYLHLLTVVILYAFVDRLNVEARYGLNPSFFSMLKQLSTVFLMIFGFIFLKEEPVITRIIGAVIIILSNILLSIDKGKIKINKYFIMSFISNFLFAVAMLINVNISDHFNLGMYTIITVSIPALLIFIFGHHSVKGLINEFNLYDKTKFLISSFCWALMLISSVRAYQLGSVAVIAPILTLTSVLNTFYEFLILKNKNKLLQKIICSIMIIIGVLLIKM